MSRTSGRHALKARMPRLYPDHRSERARVLRADYDALDARFHPSDGTARNVAVMTADALAEYRGCAVEVDRLERSRAGSAKDKALALNRLQRRKNKAMARYLAGLKTLDSLAGTGHAPNLAEQLARFHAERARG